MNPHAAPRRRRSLAFAAPVAGLLGLLALAVGLAAMTEPPAVGATAAAANRYIGADKCKNCHKAEAAGNPHGKWEKMKHAQAFATLASDESKELAKAKGVEDPQKADACLKCHVTAFGVPAEEVAKGFKPELGVQCESCHGPGEAHMKARVSAAAKGDGAAGPMPAGEIVGVPRAEVCLTCHNAESPSYKPFCFFKMNALIAHPNPAAQRSEDELKAMTNPYGCTDAECKCPKPAGAGAGEQPKDG